MRHSVEYPGPWMGPFLARLGVVRIEATLTCDGRQISIDDLIYQGPNGEVLEGIEEQLRGMIVADGSDDPTNFLDLLHDHVVCEDARDPDRRHGYGHLWMIYRLDETGMEIEASTYAELDEEPDEDDGPEEGDPDGEGVGDGFGGGP